MYHNTNQESGETLVISNIKASKQEDIVLKFYEEHPGVSYSPDAVWRECFNESVPLTSIRRAISNLTYSGKLEKTSFMVPGFYNKMVHTWRIKKSEGQTTLPL